jgi:hypothetical protein
MQHRPILTTPGVRVGRERRRAAELFTIGANFQVPVGELIRTGYEILAPLVAVHAVVVADVAQTAVPQLAGT